MQRVSGRQRINAVQVGPTPLGSVPAVPMSGAGLRPQQAAARMVLTMNISLELGETHPGTKDQRSPAETRA